MKLRQSQIETRAITKNDFSIKSDKSSGIMTWGEFNDYPQVLEKLILNSQTAKATSKIYAKFIAGAFEDSEYSKLKVSYDNFGREITLKKLTDLISDSLAKFSVAFIHCDFDMNGNVVRTKFIPAKNCRYSTQDDNGYCGKIAVSNDFKDRKKNVQWYDLFNKQTVLQSIQKAGIDEKGSLKYKGQIYTISIDDTYLYPLSPFDCVYLDMDTEFQIQNFKNTEIRNGFSDKIAMTVPEFLDKYDDEGKLIENSNTEYKEFCEKVEGWLGSNGTKTIIFESNFAEDEQIKDKAGFHLEKIENNINDKLFSDWEIRIANNIRKAANGMPAILIDYQEGKLSGTSSEAMLQAVNFYNVMTKGERILLSNSLSEIFDKDIKIKDYDFNV